MRKGHNETLHTKAIVFIMQRLAVRGLWVERCPKPPGQREQVLLINGCIRARIHASYVRPYRTRIKRNGTCYTYTYYAPAWNLHSHGALAQNRPDWWILVDMTHERFYLAPGWSPRKTVLLRPARQRRAAIWQTQDRADLLSHPPPPP